MQPLSARDILQFWEWGENQHPVDQALALLSVANHEMTKEKMAELSIGQRDKLIFQLRALTFGPKLDAYAECPKCSERLEYSVQIPDLLENNAAESKSEPQMLNVEGYEIQFRSPNSLDLAEIVNGDNVEKARSILLQRCIIKAHQGNDEVNLNTLPEGLIKTLVDQIQKTDPLSEVKLDLKCPNCGHQWHRILDIVSFFWQEITARAKRLLQEIHILARAYGWREQDILAMSDQRRQIYISMVT